MSDLSFDDKWPNWLVAVAVRVDELVAQPWLMERFQRMLRDWKAEHDRSRSRPPATGRSHTSGILPLRRLRLAEKYALLAAIHDATCENAKRIDPWRSHKALRRLGYRKAKAGLAYTFLRRSVKELRDADRERIESALREVENDLAAERQQPEHRRLVRECNGKPRGRGHRKAAYPPKQDVVDVHGYVETPVDPRAYIPAADIVARHTPDDMPLTIKQLSVILDHYTTNAVPWTRPRDKRGKPIKNRRNVHLGEWDAYIKRRTRTDAEGFPRQSEGEIEARKLAIRESKQRGK